MVSGSMYAASAAPAFRYTDWSYSKDYRVVTIGGKQYDNHTIFFRNNKTLQFIQQTSGFLCDPQYQATTSADDFFKEQDARTEFWLKRQAQYYPYSEVVAIDWVPWQETKFKDVYTNAVLANTTFDKTLVAKILANPAYNGHALELLVGKNLTAAEQEMPLDKMPVYSVKAIVYRSFDEYKADGAVWLSEPTMKDVVWQTYADFRGTLGIPKIMPSTKHIKITLRFNDPTIYIETNGVVEPKTLDVSPWCPRDTTLVPVRGVFEALGASVEWLGATKQVNITCGNLSITLQVGSKTAMVNGTAYTMPEPVQFRGDRTMVPLRFISETLNYRVTWTPPNKVEIESK